MVLIYNPLLLRGKYPASKSSVAFWMSDAFDISLIPFSFCNPGSSEVSKKLRQGLRRRLCCVESACSFFIPSFNKYCIFYAERQIKWEKLMSKQRSLFLSNYVLERETTTSKKPPPKITLLKCDLYYGEKEK